MIEPFSHAYDVARAVRAGLSAAWIGFDGAFKRGTAAAIVDMLHRIANRPEATEHAERYRTAAQAVVVEDARPSRGFLLLNLDTLRLDVFDAAAVKGALEMFS